jgi:endonuclease/exonuclease/phosphatase family metal-dependent hydrolase
MSEGDTLRFLTYNIRHAEGYDGWVSNSRVARIVSEAQPDVVGLNELWHIPRIFEQPRLLAERIKMNWEFQTTTKYLVQSLGNAVMTTGEIAGCRNLELPRGIEHRGALLVDIVLGGVEMTFGSTHLSLGRAKRAQQIETLRRELPRDRPLVLAGDFNCLPDELAPLGEFMGMIPHSPATFPAIRPRKALDHILFSSHWTLAEVRTIRSLASDHLALVADLTL